jgi:hypothetical protein
VPRRCPSPRPVGALEIATSAAGYLILLAVMSWPLVRDLVHTGPMDRPDGRLNAWILAYVGETVWTAPSRLFQAPNFHPLPDALAFSENLLLPAALVAPLQKLAGPVLAYDMALLGSLLLSGLGVQLVVRRASGDRLAAFAAGAYFAAGPHRWTRLSHLHAQVTVLMPLALLALDRFWDMLRDPPAHLPSVMPMTAAIAPEFSRRHPRAAVIFDNLHMLHDIISDILVSPKIPRTRKQAEIYEALGRFQDASSDVLPMEHWWMMGEMMGLEKMGGPAVGPFPPPASEPSVEPHQHRRP